jgi:hypothetical protein
MAAQGAKMAKFRIQLLRFKLQFRHRLTLLPIVRPTA